MAAKQYCPQPYSLRTANAPCQPLQRKRYAFIPCFQTLALVPVVVPMQTPYGSTLYVARTGAARHFCAWQSGADPCPSPNGRNCHAFVRGGRASRQRTSKRRTGFSCSLVPHPERGPSSPRFARCADQLRTAYSGVTHNVRSVE